MADGNTGGLVEAERAANAAADAYVEAKLRLDDIVRSRGDVHARLVAERQLVDARVRAHKARAVLAALAPIKRPSKRPSKLHVAMARMPSNVLVGPTPLARQPALETAKQRRMARARAALAKKGIYV